MPRCDLTALDHRPYPLPQGAWTMTMTWHDLLFAHWAVDAHLLRPLIPQGLELDTFDGTAWLSIVPFRMSGIRMRRCPPIPTTAAFPELNVRTYVTAHGKPGIWFFSLDAASPLAVSVARRFWHLPYFHARMSCIVDGDKVSYDSHRTHRAAPPARFSANYHPAGPAAPAQPGSLDEFLTERYCLYAVSPRGQLLRGEVHHAPWPLQPVKAEISVNSVAASIGLTSVRPPDLLHFSRRLDVVAWRLAFAH